MLQLGSKSLSGTLQSNFQHLMVYENPELQQKALSCLPHEQLCSRAKECLHNAREADPGKSSTNLVPETYEINTVPVQCADEVQIKC